MDRLRRTIWTRLFVPVYMGSLVAAGIWLWNWMSGSSIALGPAVAWGVYIGAMMMFLEEADRRGWIRGVFRDPSTKARLAQRRAELADQREQIITDAKGRGDQKV